MKSQALIEADVQQERENTTEKLIVETKALKL